jgi:hypothetical protein
MTSFYNGLKNGSKVRVYKRDEPLERLEGMGCIIEGDHNMDTAICTVSDFMVDELFVEYSFASYSRDFKVNDGHVMIIPITNMKHLN